jgi:hypothetical protein
MNAIIFGATAKDFFESFMPRNIVHGYEKYILCDGSDCVVVRSDFRPQPGQMIFLCTIRNGVAMVELYRTGKPETVAA